MIDAHTPVWPPREGTMSRTGLLLTGMFTCVVALPAMAQLPRAESRTPGSARASLVAKLEASKMRPRTIVGDLAEGVHCVVPEMANVHYFGFLPAGTLIEIEFESNDDADLIATLSSHQFKDGQAGGERFNSNDDGGDRNPRFSLTKDYDASWVLVVGVANQEPACYVYTARIR